MKSSRLYSHKCVVCCVLLGMIVASCVTVLICGKVAQNGAMSTQDVIYDFYKMVGYDYLVENVGNIMSREDYQKFDQIKFNGRVCLFQICSSKDGGLEVIYYGKIPGLFDEYFIQGVRVFLPGEEAEFLQYIYQGK